MSTKISFLEVSAIENGTVIDHIPSHNLFSVMSILEIDKIDKRITFGTNLTSKKIDRKAMIKISDIEIPESEYRKIIPFAPKAHISYIRNNSVAEKVILKVPDTIVGSVKCANPVCVTNLENLNTHFEVIDKDCIALKCIYCEKTTNFDQFKRKK